MPRPILVAVNDSLAGLAAADAAIDYARRLGESLCALTVVEPTEPALAAGFGNGAALSERRNREADAVLRHVAARGERAGLTVMTRRRSGTVAAEILAEAAELDAALLVVALVDEPSHAIPSIGSNTLRILEFATVPVLVIPVPHPPV
jgi:nucleotide-binding universal stress UspA family protein